MDADISHAPVEIQESTNGNIWSHDFMILSPARMAKLTDIIGHASQRQQLKKDLEQGNVSHAYLFSGPDHLGKMSLALTFAAELLSVGKSEGERLKTRTAVEKLTHSDLLVLDRLWIEEVCEDWDVIAGSSNVPQGHRAKKPAAKTDTIGIDDVRALQERLMETGMGTYRCCIIRSVERMQDAAANAFLKILEEPPEGLIFILTTESQGALLPTIVSRTRVIPFQRIATKEIRKLLDGVSEDDSRFILHIAGGAPGLAAKLRDDPDLLRLHRTVHGSAQQFFRSQSLRERLSLLTPLKERGQESDDFLLHLGLALREQPSHTLVRYTEPYRALVSDLETNAHRQLLAERFALEVHS